MVASPLKPLSLLPVLGVGIFPTPVGTGDKEMGPELYEETGDAWANEGDGRRVDLTGSVPVAVEWDLTRALIESGSPIERDFRILFAGSGGGVSSSLSLISWSYWSKRADRKSVV